MPAPVPAPSRTLRLHPRAHDAAKTRADQLGLSATAYVVQLVRADLFGPHSIVRLSPIVDARISRPPAGFTVQPHLWSLVLRRATVLGGSPAAYVETLILRELSSPSSTLLIYPEPESRKPKI